MFDDDRTARSFLEGLSLDELVGQTFQATSDAFSTALRKCTPEAFVACTVDVRQRAAATRELLFDEYERLLQTEIDTRPERNEPRILLGNLYLERSMWTEAWRAFLDLGELLREQKPLLARAHFARGQMLIKSGSRAEGRLELKRAAALDPLFGEPRDALDSIATIRLRDF
ncbi:MAG: hypothetical protein QM831_22440 [Kofleriaceae bacterium]